MALVTNLRAGTLEAAKVGRDTDRKACIQLDCPHTVRLHGTYEAKGLTRGLEGSVGRMTPGVCSACRLEFKECL